VKPSALDMFTPRYAERLPPDAKRILATLSDDVARLAYDAFNAADDEEMLKPNPPPPKDPLFDEEFGLEAGPALTYWERVNARASFLLTRAVPALGVLSDKYLDIVSRVGRTAMIARKYGPDPTDIAILQRTCVAIVDALAWTFLYYKFGKIPPTTPLREVFSADELELTGGDPASSVGDVLPRDSLVQACRDTVGGAGDLFEILEVELEQRFGRDLGTKPTIENVVARHFEILCDTISTPAFGSTPRRSWNFEDFRGREFKTPMAEIRRFLSPPGNKGSGYRDYDDLTPRENRCFKMIFHAYDLWCRRPARTDNASE
jgi:hypothetical protein